jgi:hypothetical protein
MKYRLDSGDEGCKPSVIRFYNPQLSMSGALAHFAFGVAMTTLLITILVPNIRYPRTFLLAGDGWAMLPDLHWVSPVYTQQLRAFHESSLWTDLFWLHRTLDRVDPSDSNTITSALL